MTEASYQTQQTKKMESQNGNGQHCMPRFTQRIAIKARKQKRRRAKGDCLEQFAINPRKRPSDLSNSPNSIS